MDEIKLPRAKQRYLELRAERLKKLREEYAQNPKKFIERSAKYRQNNPEKHRKASLKWQAANRKKASAVTAKWKAIVKLSTPKWLTAEQLDEIKFTYHLTKELQWLANEKLTVDHTIPIQGKNVTGLHVPWNLQIITKSKNAAKGNRIGVK